MTTTKNGSTLNKKLGTGDLKKNLGNLGAYQQIMQAFVNYITSVGVPPLLPANDHVEANITNAANNAITQLGTDFQAAQQVVANLIEQINGITDTIDAAQTYARHSEITMGEIIQDIVTYITEGTLDRDGMTSNLKRMAENASRLEESVKDAHTNTDNAVKSLQHWESKLNTDFQALQTAIPPVAGKALNLDTLTEAQAAKQLMDQVDSLNSDIHSLQTEINWLTFGEVATGVVGGLIFVTNFWNPIGWVALALTATGEVEMVGLKAADITKKNTDLQKLALTEDEKAILHPLYCIKNAVSRLSTGVDSAEAISKELESMKNDFDAAVDDVEGFINDVTKGKKADDLQSDAEYVLGDYGDLKKLCDTMLAPFPAQVVSQSQMTKVTNYKG